MITDVEQDLRQLIIETLDLEGIVAEDIDVEAPLFGDGLGLDSIDALELGVAIQKKYGMTMDGRSEEVREHFRSVKALAAFVTQTAVA